MLSSVLEGTQVGFLKTNNFKTKGGETYEEKADSHHP